MFITNAYAQAPGGFAGGDLMTFLPMIAIFVVFYFLLIRPQQKRAKETRAMLEALRVLEDCARFAKDDQRLTAELKHSPGAVARSLQADFARAGRTVTVATW